MAEWSILVGSATSGTGALTVSLPVGWAADDIHILVTESQNGNTVAAPSGFTELTGSPVVQAATQLGVFWRRAVGGDTSVSVADSGDHTYGRIIGIRGAVTTGDPIDAIGTGTGSDSATISLPTVTPTGNGRFGLQIASYAADANRSPSAATFSSAYEDLPFITGYDGSGTTSGNGGGVFFMYGVLDDTTAVSGSSMTTPGTTGGHAMVSLAITPVTSTDVLVAAERLGVVVTRSDDEIQVASQRLGVVLTTDATVGVEVASLRLGVVLDTTPPSTTTKGSVCILW